MNINSERVKRWREENPDKWKTQQDKWNASQAKKEAHEKWKAFHPDYKYTPSESVKENKRKYEAARRERGKTEFIALKSRLKTQYGLSMEEYENILEAHEGVCAICGEGETTTSNGKIRRLSIDHNHSTGEIRGLLCDRCNRGLGFFRDNKELLFNAMRYLDEY